MSPLASLKDVLPFRASDTFICIPLPLMRRFGFGECGCHTILVATWRYTSLYESSIWSQAVVRFVAEVYLNCDGASLRRGLFRCGSQVA